MSKSRCLRSARWKASLTRRDLCTLRPGQDGQSPSSYRQLRLSTTTGVHAYFRCLSEIFQRRWLPGRLTYTSRRPPRCSLRSLCNCTCPPADDGRAGIVLTARSHKSRAVVTVVMRTRRVFLCYSRVTDLVLGARKHISDERRPSASVFPLLSLTSTSVWHEAVFPGAILTYFSGSLLSSRP